jgi:hypothetical protein
MTEYGAMCLIAKQLENSTGNYDDKYLSSNYPHLVPELRPGDIIKTKDGHWYQVLHRDLWQRLYISPSRTTMVATVTSMCRTDEIKNIIKGMVEIYRDLKGDRCFEQMVNYGKFKVWKNPKHPVREVTVAELEKELGYKIKIVKEK